MLAGRVGAAVCVSGLKGGSDGVVFPFATKLCRLDCRAFVCPHPRTGILFFVTSLFFFYFFVLIPTFMQLVGRLDSLFNAMFQIPTETVEQRSFWSPVEYFDTQPLHDPLVDQYHHTDPALLSNSLLPLGSPATYTSSKCSGICFTEEGGSLSPRRLLHR